MSQWLKIANTTRGEAMTPERQLLVETSDWPKLLCLCFRLSLSSSEERYWPLSRDSLETFVGWPCPWPMPTHPLYFHKIQGFGEVNLGMITDIKSTIFWPDIICFTFPVIIITALISNIPPVKTQPWKKCTFLNRFHLMSSCASSKQCLCWTGG